MPMTDTAVVPEAPEDDLFLRLFRTLALDVCAESHVNPRRFTPEALSLMRALPWRVDPTELRRVLVRVMSAGRPGAVQLQELLDHVRIQGQTPPARPAEKLKEARLRFEREFVLGVLERHAWRMSEAARALGLQRPNLYRKARRLGLRRPARSWLPERSRRCV
jgi:DNA-binding NtrC family response regulator